MAPERAPDVNRRDTPGFARAVRLASALVSLALIAWALADDNLIGGGPGFGSTQAALVLVGLILGVTCLLPLAWNARALALVLSSLVMLAVIEAALQILFSASYKSENELDSRLLYRPVPGAVRIGNREAINGGDRITYTINSQGFRGDELELEPGLRIVVYGDSFVQGYYSNEPNTFVERLAHHLSSLLGRDVEVVNAGVAGYGPDQELRKMKLEIPLLGPDLVLVAIFTGNDFGDLLRNKLYRLDDDGELRENESFSLAPALEREMKLGREESILKRLIRDSLVAIAVRTGLRPGLSNGVEDLSPLGRMEYFRERHVREYEEYVVEDDRVVRDLAWDSYDADVSLTPGSASARYKVALMDRIVEEMQRVCAGSGVPLVLVPIPHPLDLGEHATGEVDLAKYPEYQRRRMVGILEEIATRHGIRSIDLFTPFQNRGSAELYFRGFDDHWNDVGQDLAGELVARDLASSGLFDRLASQRSRSTERTP